MSVQSHERVWQLRLCVATAKKNCLELITELSYLQWRRFQRWWQMVTTSQALWYSPTFPWLFTTLFPMLWLPTSPSAVAAAVSALAETRQKLTTEQWHDVTYPDSVDWNILIAPWIIVHPSKLRMFADVMYSEFSMLPWHSALPQ